VQEGVVSRTFLYRIYDAQGVLLYVGISKTFAARLARHHQDQPWADEIAEVKCHPFPDRESAHQAEVEAIRLEKPVHNQQHKVKPSASERMYEQWDSASVEDRQQAIAAMRSIATAKFEDAGQKDANVQGILARLVLELDPQQAFPRGWKA
jgi:predicted GIY-YIG superfamily endonuclease